MNSILTLPVTGGLFDLMTSGEWDEEEIWELFFHKSHDLEALLDKEYDFVAVKNKDDSTSPLIVFLWDKYRNTLPAEETPLGTGGFICVRLGDFVKYKGETLSTPIADREYACDAFPWIDNHPLGDLDFNFSQLRKLSKAKRLGEIIKSGARYTREYLVSCEGNPSVFRANTVTHELNLSLELYQDVC